MSAPKYRIPAKVRAILLDRGLSVQALAEKSGVPARRVLRSLSGHPEANDDDSIQLARFLTIQEIGLLGWMKPGVLLVPWNNRPVARGTIPAEKAAPNTFRNAGPFGTAQNAAQFDADLAEADE